MKEITPPEVVAFGVSGDKGIHACPASAGAPGEHGRRLVGGLTSGLKRKNFLPPEAEFRRCPSTHSRGGQWWPWRWRWWQRQRPGARVEGLRRNSASGGREFFLLRSSCGLVGVAPCECVEGHLRHSASGGRKFFLLMPLVSPPKRRRSRSPGALALAGHAWIPLSP